MAVAFEVDHEPRLASGVLTESNGFEQPIADRDACVEFLSDPDAGDIEIETVWASGGRTVTITQDGSTIVDKTYPSSFDVSFPNGEQCGPTCYTQTETASASAL